MFGNKQKPLVVVGEHFKTILENLYNLEINTIVKDNITGQKMPPPEHALIDLAQLYDLKLAELGAPFDRGGGEVSGGPSEYEQIHRRAQSLISALAGALVVPDDRAAEVFLVYRIRDTAAQMKSVFQAAAARQQSVPDPMTRASASEKPVELKPDELVLLRKAWDLGLEEIAFQTVIQLDGDVLQRLHPRYAGTQQAALLGLHDGAVRTCLDYWRTLVDLLGAFAEGVGRLLGARSA